MDMFHGRIGNDGRWNPEVKGRLRRENGKSKDCLEEVTGKKS
jgi:hypothetical protein